ncbi:MAG: phage major capsid protein [Clostridia bacterium]|nr:phage major capsid protein [Clostridia bacterium]
METIVNTAFENALRSKDTTDRAAIKELFSPASNSYRIPKEMNASYNSALKKENLFRRYGVEIYAKDCDTIINTVCSTADADIVDVGKAYPADSDEFDMMNFESYKIATLCKISNVLVNEKTFNVTKYLSNEFAKRFGRAEEKYFITGDGNNQPLGILNTADVGVKAAEITYDEIIKLYFSLKPEYRKHAIWFMNDETALALRTLKDNSGSYIWNSTNDTIFGRPVEISNHMPKAESGNKPVFFGDLSYYWILQRDRLCIKPLYEKFSLEGAVGYIANERLDGKLIRKEAVKTMLITA